MLRGKWLAGLGISGLALAVGLTCSKPIEPEHKHSFGPAVSKPGPSHRVYSFGVLPIYNPLQVAEIYEPLTALINSRHAAFKMKFEAAQNYADHESKILRKGFDFAIVNPYQAIIAEKYGYRIFAKVNEDQQYTGVILTRKQDKINRPSDLKNKTISFAAPTALAGTMMVRVFLKQHGVDVQNDMKMEFVQSSDSAVLRVFAGISDAAGTGQLGWDRVRKLRPELERELKVSWKTKSLPNLAIIVSDQVPEADVAVITNILNSMDDEPAVQSVLKSMYVTGFNRASSSTYDSVRRFLSDYKIMFGELPIPEQALR